MTQIPVTNEMVERLRAGDSRSCPFDRPDHGLKPDEPCPICGDLGTEKALEETPMCVSFSQHKLIRDAADEIERLTVALQGMTAVPTEALLWLTGEAPDADGKWFGECEEAKKAPLAGKYPRTYWWRSKFRSMVPNWPDAPPPPVPTGTGEATKGRADE